MSEKERLRAAEQDAIDAEKRGRAQQLADGLARVQERLKDCANHLRQLQERETACKGEIAELLRKRIWKLPGKNRVSTALWIDVAGLDAELKYGAQCSKLYEDYVKQTRDEEATLLAALEEIEP